jgi:hypothetical protein
VRNRQCTQGALDWHKGIQISKVQANGQQSEKATPLPWVQAESWGACNVGVTKHWPGGLKISRPPVFARDRAFIHPPLFTNE